MFNTKKIEDLQKEIDRLEKENERLEEEAILTEQENLKNMRALRHEHEDVVRLLNNRIDDANRNTENIKKEQKLAQDTLMGERIEEIRGLRAQVVIAEKEVVMLRTAFKNMGFDVKDMKDILSRLTDAVVAKNEVKVLTSK